MSVSDIMTAGRALSEPFGHAFLNLYIRNERLDLLLYLVARTCEIVLSGGFMHKERVRLMMCRVVFVNRGVVIRLRLCSFLRSLNQAGVMFYASDATSRKCFLLKLGRLDSDSMSTAMNQLSQLQHSD